ncbi:xylulokinase [Phaeacidiphilus oryzae]|uniref:xylulokinase n=1 Tax=Phaeacidiphilus oryzae TaxID=348818 RepID=UPI000569DB38|nr:xylulokinase [Phaeacidiphilus oryzae]
MVSGVGNAPLVVGVDSSTQATKAVVVDVETGEIVAEGRSAHTVSGSGGARESDPRDWWRALGEALAATGRAERAEAVSVGGQQHGMVTLDADGEVVRPATLWNDVRSAPQAEALVAARGADWWAGRVGSVPTAAFTATSWAWLRENEPESADRARHVRLPHDYLTSRLIGSRQGVTDRGDASGTGWWSPAGYDHEVLELIGLDASALPEVVEPGKAAGEVAAAIAGQGLPLRAGALVASGTGDNMAAAVGLGLRPGAPVISLGTSGTAYAVTSRRPADPSGIVAGFADALGDWLPLACTLNCTLAVDKVAALLGRDRQDVEPGGEVVLLPFLDGERTPNLPYASGLLAGLRHDTTPGQVLQAAYDGAAYALLAALHDVQGDEGADEPLMLIGGGARGRAWRDTVRRLSGRPVLVPEAQELVALGAAAQAAALVTGERADEVARRWGTRRGVLLDPLPRDEAALERLGAAFERARPLLDAPLGR